jgi:hypothetical protein
MLLSAAAAAVVAGAFRLPAEAMDLHSVGVRSAVDVSCCSIVEAENDANLYLIASQVDRDGHLTILCWWHLHLHLLCWCAAYNCSSQITVSHRTLNAGLQAEAYSQQQLQAFFQDMVVVIKQQLGGEQCDAMTHAPGLSYFHSSGTCNSASSA